MPDVLDHIAQANHNRQCAGEFLARYRDWAITATFYAAVHLVEAGLTATDIGHSDSRRPEGEMPHDYRERLVRERFGDTCYKCYRKLRTASYNVRYLVLSQNKPGVALDYYSQDSAKGFLEKELPQIRREIEKVTGINLL